MDESLMPMPSPTDRTTGDGSDGVDAEMVRRLMALTEQAETYKIAMIVVACVLGAVLIISMVVMYHHYNNKIKNISEKDVMNTKF